MRWAQIRDLDISNGKGVGIALFTQGCPFHCFNCFNPETWDFDKGNEWTEEVQKDFLKLAERPYIDRISFLGGEPLAEQNTKELLILVKALKDNFPTKKIWLYSGFTFEKIFNSTEETFLVRQQILSYVDILVDGQYIDDLKDYSLRFRGSSNQRIIDVKKTLSNEDKAIVLYEE